MIRFRAFRNGDPPALAQLWNRALPLSGVARPLTSHEFDAAVVGRIDFGRDRLIIAESETETDRRVVGFAHAGFGPVAPLGPTHRLDHQLGTVAMLVTDPDPSAAPPDLALALFREAEDRLRAGGAQVLYAGGQLPLDPFYRAIYGGGEFSGILDTHAPFQEAARAAGYQPVARTVRLETDPGGGEIRDPKAILVRRMARVAVEDDAAPVGWWESVSLGTAEITRFSLRSKTDDRTLATATTWDAAAFGRDDGRLHACLYDVAVPPEHRRKGFARFLVAEVIRHLHAQARGDVLTAQTDATNTPAVALYRGLGFREVGSSTLFRRPGP